VQTWPKFVLPYVYTLRPEPHLCHCSYLWWVGRLLEYPTRWQHQWQCGQSALRGHCINSQDHVKNIRNGASVMYNNILIKYDIENVIVITSNTAVFKPLHLVFVPCRFYKVQTDYTRVFYFYRLPYFSDFDIPI